MAALKAQHTERWREAPRRVRRAAGCESMHLLAEPNSPIGQVCELAAKICLTAQIT